MVYELEEYRQQSWYYQGIEEYHENRQSGALLFRSTLEPTDS
jgi:hypothetical protein